MIRKISLLDRAKADLQSAQLILSQNSHDELLLDIAAYHVQQGIEKLVKFTLASNGVQYKQTHDMFILLEQLEDADIEIMPWLEENADTLNSYATKTRYGSDIVATRKKIIHLRELAGDYAISLQPERSEDDTVKPNNLV